MIATNVHYHHTKEAIANEESLILAAKKNTQAFAPLYDKYYVQIFRFILKRTGSENTTSDITSQVFVKAMSSLSKYQFKGVPFGSWLHMIARNELNLLYRSKKYNRIIDAKTDQLLEIVENHDSFDNSEDVSDLIKAIEQLSLDEIELLEMRYFEKRPFKEVSEILDISESNAKVKMHRIVAKLKKIML